MTAVDWDEVKRLAADFQKAQLSSTLQKLSERNCIEIISKLTESRLLDILYTNDGKEYVTPQHLGKEIRDELYVRGGRVSLVELAQTLNVGLPHVTKVVGELERHSKGLKVILGQLIDKSYVNKIAEEINDKLGQNGHINVSELLLQYDLPAEFLQSVIEKGLGKTIFGKQDTQDPRVFYTENFIARNRAKIRGALSAITKPTPLSAVLGQCSVPERIFYLILDSLHGMKQVPGVVTGKQSGNSIYVPTIYSRSQIEWADNFYKQNGYLEYDALVRLGLSDPISFVKSHFATEDMVFLDSVAVGSTITDQVEANVEEIVATGSFVDIYPLLPSVFTAEDAEILLKSAARKTNAPVHVFATTVAVSEAFLRTLNEPLEQIAERKARDAVASGRWMQSVAQNKIKSKSADVIVESKSHKKEERRKKATSGKAGGGSQGRETKTKSTKRKYLQGKAHDNDSDDDYARPSLVARVELELVTTDEVREEIASNDNLAAVENLPEELAAHFQPKLNKHALSVAEQLAQSSKTTNLSEVEERLNVLATNVRIFDKGVRHLDKSDQPALTAYLLKSLGVSFATEIFKLAAQQNMSRCPESLTTEARQKVLQELPADVREPLSQLHRSVAGSSVEDFLSCTEAAMAACCLVLKKFDKKKERPFVLGHRQALLEELNATQDPALALHLVSSVLFTAATNSALHMSGRHVSAVLSFLGPHLQPNTIRTLQAYYDSVLKLLGSSDEGVKSAARDDLEAGLVEIKNIANNFRQQLNSDNSQE